MADTRITQTTIETLTRSPAAARVSQITVELLGAIAAAPQEARVTQAAIETLSSATDAATRVTQLAVELLSSGLTPARVTQLTIEVLSHGDVVPVLATPRGMTLVRRLRQTPIITDEDILIRFDAFEVDLQAGVGNVLPPGVDPTVVMQYSDDAGMTWSDEYRLSAGQIGDYVRRVRWTRLGVSRNRVFRIWCTDPVFWVVLNGYLEMKKGRF